MTRIPIPFLMTSGYLLSSTLAPWKNSTEAQASA
jgi:hypothetical protein